MPIIIIAILYLYLLLAFVGGEDGGRYINRKGFFSVNVQMITNAAMIINNIVARWPGSTHDSRIFANSQINRRLENRHQRGYLLGDSGYACLPYLMNPIRNPATAPERRYNSSHAKTRNVVERAFGIMKKRFPCLQMLRTKLRNSLTIIVAVSVLHNIALMRGDPQPNEEEDNNDEENDDDIDHDRVEDNRNGIAIRRASITQHFQ